MFNEKRKKLADALSSEQQGDFKKVRTASSKNEDSITQNLSELKNIQGYLYQIKEDIQNEAKQIDWEQNAAEILRKVNLEEDPSQSTVKGFFNCFLKTHYKLGFAAVTIVAFGLIFLFLIEKKAPIYEHPIIPANSVEDMENTLAKNETVEYLRQSSIVLSSVANMPITGLDNDILKLNAEHAKSLLLKKKYFNQNLNNYKLANAQSVCNQVEYILYDISQIKNSTDTDSLINLRNFIQDKKIMLKIRLVQFELTNKEV